MKRASSIVVFFFILVVWLGTSVLFSCKDAKEPLIPGLLLYEFDAPAHFPTPVYNFENNTITKAHS